MVLNRKSKQENHCRLKIDQDELGTQAQRIIKAKNIQVWLKPLADGSSVVWIFNMGEKYKSYNLVLKQIGINKTIAGRDIWKQKNIGQSAQGITFNILPHGVRLIKIIKGK